LTATERAALTKAGTRYATAVGTTLLDRRDTSGDVLILSSGLVKIVAWPPVGQTLVLAVRGPGDIVGELAHLCGGRRSATVIAIDDIEALRLPCVEFARLLHRNSNASDVLRCTVVERLGEADRDRLAVASMTVRQRLARLLIKLAQRYGTADPRGGVTVHRLSHGELAACVSGARRTVVRELARWRDRRIISTTRLSVTVYRPDVLAHIAGPNSPPP
jgi:CRP-like cAMP-binding protein